MLTFQDSLKWILGIGIASLASGQDCDSDGILDADDVPSAVIAWSHPLGSNVWSIRRSGDLVIAGADDAHILRADPNAAGTLTQIGLVPSPNPGVIFDAAFWGDGAFLAKPASLEFVDLSDPTNPVVTASAATTGFLLAIETSGSFVFAAVPSNGDGLEIYDATDLTLVGSLPFPGAEDLVVQGDLVWVATSNGLLAIDVSDPTGPVLVGSSDPSGFLSVVVDGNRAIAVGQSGWTIFDVTDPTQLKPLSSVPGTFSTDVALEGDTVYIGTISHLEVWNVADAANPAMRWREPLPTDQVFVHGGHAYLAKGGLVRSIRVRNQLDDPIVRALTPAIAEARASWSIEGDVAFLSNGIFGLDVYDVSRPFDPQPIGEWEPMPPVTAVLDLEVHGDFAFGCDPNHGLVVFDITFPACPTLATTLPLAGGAVAIDIDGSHAYCVDPTTGLVIVDISDPLLPAVVATAGLSGNSEDVVVAGGRAYLFEDISMQILDVSDPANPASLHAEPSLPGVWRSGVVYGQTLVRLGDSIFDPGIAAFNVADPASLGGAPLVQLGASLPLLGVLDSATLDGRVLHVATGSAGLARIDLSDIQNGPQLLDQDALAGLELARVARHGEHLLVTDALGAVASVNVAKLVDGDCNDNNVPDACDITAGVESDLDGNGIPDSCDPPPPGLACQELDLAPPAGVSILLASTAVQRVSLKDGGGQISTTAACGFKNNAHPTVSDDGNIVAFSSDAQDVAGVMNLTGKRQVYAHFVSTQKTILVSGTGSLGPGNGFDTPGSGGKLGSDYPIVSGDGNVIVYYSGSTNLSPLDTTPSSDFYLYDILAGTTELVSVSNLTGLAGKGASAGYSAVSSNGRFIAFDSKATDLIDPANYGGALPYSLDPMGAIKPRSNVYLVDRGVGPTPTLEWLSVGRDGQGNFVSPDGKSQHPAMSRDGCRIVFDSFATNFSPELAGQGGAAPRIWVMNRGTDGVEQADEVFALCGSAPPGDSSNFDKYSQRPDISGDGKWVVFESLASNLVTAQSGDDVFLPDDNGLADVFLLEVDTGELQRIDVTAYPSSAPVGQKYPDAPHSYQRISGSGRFVVFTASESFDCDGDGNDEVKFRLYCLDRDVDGNGVFDDNTELVRLSDMPDDTIAGLEADDYAGGNCGISADGQYVVFMSDSTDFAVGELDTNGDQGDDSACPQGCSPPNRWGRDIFRRRVW